MHFLACALLAVGQTAAPDHNVDLRRGRDGWQGDGFYLTHGSPTGPGARAGVCSSDAGSPARKGKITHRFTVPDRAEALVGRAFLVVPRGGEMDHRLDVVVVLPDEGNRLVQKQVRTTGGWTPVAGLLPRWEGQPREYRWDLAEHRGKAVQVIVRDQDDRPGRYVYAGGFRVVGGKGPTGADSPDQDEFTRHMLALELKHKLLPMARFDSKRFTAISNASEKLTHQHLRHYELFYDLFLDHFRRRGFAVHAPDGKLMVAAFDAPAGFNAYFGEKLAPMVAGIYHPKTNRLVVYDLSHTKHFQMAKAKTLEAVARRGGPNPRTDSVERIFREAAFDQNLGTALHECAHQLSFNCGLLNREGYTPAWLAEGLACYCEATEQGDLQSIGAPNRKRIDTLRRAAGKYMPLPDLIKADTLLKGGPNVLLAYAQSWALFRMLMEERTAAMRDHLTLIHPRRTPEYYVADFRTSFGHDLAALDRRYRAYMDNLVAQYPAPTIR